MSALLIIVGLILLLAGSGWFAGAATVGTILAIAGGVILAIEVAWFVFVAGLANRGFKKF